MKRQLILMFLLSLGLGLILLHPIALASKNIPTYLVHASTLAFFLVLLSAIISLIPKFIYWLMKIKHPPKIIVLMWTIWIPLTILVCFNQLYNSNTPSPQSSPITSANIDNNNTAQTIYNKVSGSIYSVYGKDANNQSITGGSAVSVSTAYLATNCHIIKDADHFTVLTTNGEKLGVLYSKHDDLCIITVPGLKTIPVEIRPSKSVSIGEVVFAIGNPEELTKSISNGIISNKFDMHGITILQTNAAISPGSSGGGLFDHNGKLIGITTSRLGADDNAQNINFALPTELIEAALLDPAIETTTSNTILEPTNSSNQVATPSKNLSSNPANISSKPTLLGVYGKDEISLISNQNDCFIAIPGRFTSGKITSMAVFFPAASNILVIFSIITNPLNTINFFNWLNQSNDVQYSEAKSTLFFGDTLHPLTIIAIDKVKQPVFVYSQKKPLTEDLLTLDYLIAQFYNYSQDNGMTSITFGLNGFTEALSQFNKSCYQGEGN